MTDLTHGEYDDAEKLPAWLDVGPRAQIGQWDVLTDPWTTSLDGRKTCCTGVEARLDTAGYTTSSQLFMESCQIAHLHSEAQRLLWVRQHAGHLKPPSARVTSSITLSRPPCRRTVLIVLESFRLASMDCTTMTTTKQINDRYACFPTVICTVSLCQSTRTGRCQGKHSPADEQQ